MWLRKVLNSCDFVWIGTDAFPVYDMSKEADSVLSKLAFVFIKLESGCFNDFECFFQPLIMDLHVFSMNEDVIHVRAGQKINSK